MDEEAKKLITKARIQVINENPFFSYLLMRMDMQEDPNQPEGLPVGVTSDGRCTYSPEGVKNFDVSELKGIMVHEALHLALNHVHEIRRGSRIPMKWNIASDYVVNLIVRSEGYSLPKGVLLDNHYKDMSVEEVYDDLPEREDGQGQQCNGDSDGDGDEQSQQQSSSGTGQSDDQSDDDDTGGGQSDEESDKDSDEDSGGQRDNERNDERAFDEHRETSTGDVKEDRDIAEKWQDVFVSAYEFAKMQGNSPGGRLGDIHAELFQQNIGWRSLLWKFVTNQLITDYKWTRPSKKSRQAGAYLPSVERKSLELVVCFDTSGSISDEEFKTFLSEIWHIFKAFRQVDMTILFHTTDVKEVKKVRNQSLDDFLENVERYTGGTSHMDVFNWIKTERHNADAVICFTDGYTTTPEYCRIPTIWITTGTDDYFQFGHVKKVNLEDL